MVGKLNVAQKYFHKSSSLDPNFAPAWIGFGNSFAVQDESDQAMASYRTASRLCPGSHLPGLCIGMEYLRTNNLALAYQYVERASHICPTDPLVQNELGAILYKMNRYQDAKQHLENAIELCAKLPRRLWSVWEPCIFNLGHVYRKLRRFDEAIRCYQTSISLSTNSVASAYTALGLTHHLQGKPSKAIESYHIALGLKPEDTVSADLLSRALKDEFESSTTFQRSGQQLKPKNTSDTTKSPSVRNLNIMM